MSNRLIVTPEAEADIAQALDWYQKQRDGLGEVFLRCLDRVFDRITHSLETHAITYRNVRQTLVRKFPYLVCYLYNEEQVNVVAVFHASRASEGWQSRVD